MRMTIHRRLLPVAGACALLIAGCGAPASPPAAITSEGATQPAQLKVVQACKLITLEEIAALAGKPLPATPDEGGGATTCVWEPEGGGLPRVELKIERGSAEAAMTAFGMLEKHEPGISNPYDDLGDEAVAIGPAVMIKRDDDLFTITALGVDDSEAAVHKIYETATARM
jgi:hypothetical protein